MKEYEQLAKQFNPTKFNAEAWVQMAEDAGMKYMVITSKHHDGFAMYRSAVSKYNIYDATPFHRDPLKELADACKRHHIRFGFYYSQAQDWHEPNGAGNTWDFGPDDEEGLRPIPPRAKPSRRSRNSSPATAPYASSGSTRRAMMTNDRGSASSTSCTSMQPATLIDGRLGRRRRLRLHGRQPDSRPVVKGDWEVPAT